MHRENFGSLRCGITRARVVSGIFSGKRGRIRHMADVTKIKNVKVGDEVVLLGGPIKTEDVAKKIGTIDYEVLSRLNPNLPRVVI